MTFWVLHPWATQRKEILLNNDDLEKDKMIFQSVTQAAQKRKSETMTFWLSVQILYH